MRKPEPGECSPMRRRAPPIKMKGPPVLGGRGADTPAMPRPLHPTLSLDELRDALRRAEPSVCLIAPRVLRRLVRNHVGLGIGRHGLVAKTRAVLQHASPEELGLPSGVSSELVTLLEEPAPRRLESTPAGDLLRPYWQWLVQLRAFAWMAERPLSSEALRERLQAFDPGAFSEVRAVLVADGLVPREGDDRTVYNAFVALYAALRHLAPGELADTFPGLCPWSCIDRVVAEDLDAPALLERLRPDGAAEPTPIHAPEEAPEFDDLLELGEEDPQEPVGEEVARGRQPPGSEAIHDHLMRRAAWAERRGNLVRAAIDRTLAARSTTPARAGVARAQARATLSTLADQLVVALGEADPDDPEADAEIRRAWRSALESLREPAAAGFRSSAARLLYDLQLISLDHERPTYELDVVEWVLSFGRRSIQRLLPNHQIVRRVGHLRRALKLAGRARLAEPGRRRLARLLHAEIDRSEEQLRNRLRPLIERVLDRAELRHANIAERVARAKLIEELLDAVVARGYFTAGDLRDAVARNPLKLPDLTVQDLARGDRLLRSDRRMAIALEGIYRRAEVYLRGLQKGSSIAFGTAVGRWLTLFVAVPFAGAFVVLEGLQHLTNPVIRLAAGQPLFPRHEAGSGGHDSGPLHLVSWISVALLGFVFLGLIHSRWFRAAVVRILKAIGSGVRFVALDAPLWVLRRPPILALLRHPYTRALGRWAVLPIVPAVPAGLAARGIGGDATGVVVATFVFVLAVWLLNSRTGRRLQEVLSDVLIGAWHWTLSDLLPGLYRIIMGFFRSVLQAIDQLLYAVDELLRFRAGQSRLTLSAKALGGMIWGLIAYVVRFVTNLLVEPQVNPIKHFPVVTVAHKVTLPFMLALPTLLERAPFGLSAGVAWFVAWALQMLVPGVFGFLAWELKENWRLYEANRERSLRPVRVGSHGETIARILRPGFHSGTLPRTFARLRRADRAERPRARYKHRETLRHVQHDVRHFIERELLALMEQGRSLAGLRFEVDDVRLTTNCIAIILCRPDRSDDPLRLRFDEQSGWLVAGLGDAPAWLAELGESARTALADALVGLYHKAGIELVHEQVRALLQPPWAAYALTPRGLQVWLPGTSAAAVEFDLRAGAEAAVARRVEAAVAEPTVPGPTVEPSLAAEQIIFAQNPVRWSSWVDLWERDRAGEMPLPRLAKPDVLPSVRPLPVA
jgi:hypothetical protein